MNPGLVWIPTLWTGVKSGRAGPQGSVKVSQVSVGCGREAWQESEVPCEAPHSSKALEVITGHLPTGTGCALRQGAPPESSLQKEVGPAWPKLDPATAIQEHRSSDQQPALIKPPALIEFLL